MIIGLMAFTEITAGIVQLLLKFTPFFLGNHGAHAQHIKRVTVNPLLCADAIEAS